MVPAWIALCAWLAAWTALAFLSMHLLKNVRPGEKVPMRRRYDGAPAWWVAPGVAALFTPGLALLVGVVTLVASYFFSGGRAPFMNVVLAGVFVFAHWAQVHTAVEALRKARGEPQAGGR